MDIIRARTAGFCMGVSLALKKLDGAITEQAGEPEKSRIVTFGPIIHNPQVLALYESLGVCSTENALAIAPQDVVVIRAHGIPRDIEAELRKQGARIRDATCPKVKQAQLRIFESTANGETLLLFGESNHPEVKGLVSYARGPVCLFDSLDVLKGLSLQPGGAYVLAAQTTQDQAEFARINAWLATHVGDLPVLQTICEATSKRQDEAHAIALQVDAMIVVGGKTSGNTRRLAELSRECGVTTWHIEEPEELSADILRSARTIGLTAGASTPKAQIDRTQAFLEKLS